MSKTVGVLGLQGAYAKHSKMLDQLGIKNLIVRYPDEIEKCDGLVIPGGESSTMSILIDQMDLRKPLQRFKKPILATCAGVILLSENKSSAKVKPLHKLPLLCERNAYGRQIESFMTTIEIQNEHQNFPAIFIRGPKISQIKSNKVEVLAQLDNSPVLVKYKNIMAATFHPELSNNTRIHEIFINLI
ncbi:MAG: pyridoxal 5'-phosphate synthase glutaminase subunit PdxT [Candidatus Marinimicrobia bacterium]|nr:pyridoxal 5'-phosphate synthase glutaminase subunit PdxT [Candidatus Neomarinimicrobiota bacterium]